MRLLILKAIASCSYDKAPRNFPAIAPLAAAARARFAAVMEKSKIQPKIWLAKIHFEGANWLEKVKDQVFFFYASLFSCILQAC